MGAPLPFTIYVKTNSLCFQMKVCTGDDKSELDMLLRNICWLFINSPLWGVFWSGILEDEIFIYELYVLNFCSWLSLYIICIKILSYLLSAKFISQLFIKLSRYIVIV